ncbi:hypothetical protein H6F98_18770 [Microcoleus sp. FACHB-SPT15]|uniref:hypothetical protein n=1 Tax=Microcoleus sp. FACHB-SPT15 TaxID=2692830 RepID=UPI001785A823|nr:hypothetical protein [Microcoleus sp. FACHB-SPT15]MBD1807474.1 hypothetical protein [Microcoleus sp. FACHB-SPT15]
MESQLIEKQVDLDDCTISYWAGGLTSNSAPILFLPGWAVSIETYLESLNKEFSVFCMSNRYRWLAEATGLA